MTPHQDTSTEREALKPCPFCGKTHTAEITTAQELAEQDSDYDGEFWQHSDSFAVICNASRPNGPGGCGASGGFFATKAEAIAAWNRRAALASRDEASQQPQGQAVSDEEIARIVRAVEDKDKVPSFSNGFYTLTPEELSAFTSAILALRPQAVPMTDEQIEKARVIAWSVDKISFYSGVRTAEAHHGITAPAGGEKQA